MTQNMIHLFIRHVNQFLSDLSLINPHKKILLSISGGLDSLCLFHIFKFLGLNFEVVHFNHGTRGEGNLLEEELLKKLCKNHQYKLHLYHFSFDLNESDFEQKARNKRREVYQEFLTKDYWVYTAHHLDDSFEWSLMQMFKQSGERATLGIPVFNNGIVRPFMCVTKSQLLSFAKKSKIRWLEDESNKNIRYERNKMRLLITSEIKKNYPQSLKHYVSRQNQKAYDLALHRKSSLSHKSETKKDASGGIEIESFLFLPIKDEIKKWVQHFSLKNRGEIDFELTKICESHDEQVYQPGSFIKGPLSLSGNVSLYILKNSCFILGSKEKEFYSRFDLELMKHLALTQIPGVFLISHYPHLMIDRSKKSLLKTKLVHRLLPLTCAWLKEQGISYSFTPLIAAPLRQKLVSKAVMLDSSLILP